MILRFKKYLTLACLLLFFQVTTSQSTFQQKLDSLENMMNEFEKVDTLQIQKIGNYILENSSSPQQHYKIYQKISESYFRTNNIYKSITYLFKAKEVAEKVGDPILLAQAYGSIANQYSYLNLNEKAGVYLNKAIGQIEMLAEGRIKYRLKALSFIELGNLEFNVHNYGKANIYYKKSLLEFNRINKLDHTTIYHYRRSLYNIGNSYYYLKAPDAAENYLLRALYVKDSLNLNLNYYIYSTLAEVYNLRGDYRRAVDTLLVVINDTAFKIPSLRAEIYLNLSKNYKLIGDSYNYAVYNEKHLALIQNQNAENSKAIGNAFEVEHEELNANISQSRKFNKWLLGTSGAIIFICTVTIFFLYIKKKNERKIYLSIIAKLENTVKVQNSEKFNNVPDLESAHNIPVAVEKEIVEKLENFMQTQKFRNPKLTLSMLAVDLETNPTYLSTIIRKQYNKNFNTFINELRIRYICEKIHRHPEYLNYKISYLAQDCGFTSHSTFSTVFKIIAGISPSVFLREGSKNHSINQNL